MDVNPAVVFNTTVFALVRGEVNPLPPNFSTAEYMLWREPLVACARVALPEPFFESTQMDAYEGDHAERKDSGLRKPQGWCRV